jgi:hypothetical protein
MLCAMSGITLATAQEKLNLWLSAEGAVALGQSVAHEGKALTRANLAQIREQIDYWQAQVQRLSRTRTGIYIQSLELHG